MNFGTTVQWCSGRLNRSGLSFSARVAPLVSAIAYWLAVGLPVLYLPVFASGIETTAGLGRFLGLLGLQLFALVAGRNHDPGTGPFEHPSGTLNG